MSATVPSPVGRESHTITVDLYDDQGGPITIEDTKEPITLVIPRNMDYVTVPAANVSGMFTQISNVLTIALVITKL